MNLMPRYKDKKNKSSGIALLLVIAMISVLSLLVKESIIVSQVHQKIAFNSLNQLKAFYLAKSAYKLSLLRLKAYKQVKSFVSSLGDNAPISQSLIEKIWNTPLIFPVPSGAISEVRLQAFKELEEKLEFPGSFNAQITSESSKFNLNSILFFDKNENNKKSDTSKNKDDSKSTSNSNNDESKTKKVIVDTRESLYEIVTRIVNTKLDTDEEFSDRYKHFKFDQLINDIIAWIDLTFNHPSPNRNHYIPYKRAPIYSITELHMIKSMDDTLYDIFNDYFTVNSNNNGMNVNKLESNILQALFFFTEEELSDYKDYFEEGESFKNVSDFCKYLHENISYYYSFEDESEVCSEFEKHGIKLSVSSEKGSFFKISVISEVEGVKKSIDAWVNIDNDKKKVVRTNVPTKSGSGIIVTFMRLI